MTNYSAHPPTTPPVPESAWFKSSYSGQNGGNCVEVAVEPSTVRVRDSKDKQGPSLSFTPQAWAAFAAFTASRDLSTGAMDI